MNPPHPDFKWPELAPRSSTVRSLSSSSSILTRSENALESVPDFAFDLSKTLVESVCKTVLADIGQPADPKWNVQKLLKETTNLLVLLPRNHPDPAKARDSVKKTLQGMLQTI